MERDLHSDVLFLESHLEELNSRLTSGELTNLQRKQIEDRIQLVLCLIERYHLSAGDLPFIPTERKPTLSEQPAQDAAAKPIQPLERAS